MTLEQKMTAVSALAAVFSAAFALWSISVAKKALRISERDIADKQAPFSLYLMDGFRIRADTDGRPTRILSFSVAITNTATIPNSVLRIELHVDCLGDDGKSVKYILPHDFSLSKAIRDREITPFKCPTLFDSKESKSMWVIFAESPVIPDTVRRDTYSLVVTDARGASVTTSAVLIRDLPI